MRYKVRRLAPAFYNHGVESNNYEFLYNYYFESQNNDLFFHSLDFKTHKYNFLLGFFFLSWQKWASIQMCIFWRF